MEKDRDGRSDKELHNQAFTAYHTQLLEMTPDDLQSHLFTVIADTSQLQAHQDEIEDVHATMEEAHAGQIRRYSKQPYKVHPQRIALLYAKFCELQGREIDPNTFKAAIGHDVIEDSELTVQDITERHGDEVAGIVEAMTKDSRKKKQKGDFHAIRKVFEAHRKGIKDIKLLKTIDTVDKLRDQQDVRRPLMHQQIQVWSSNLKESDYRKWKRNVLNTKVAFIPALLLRNPQERGILFAAAKASKTEIKSRPRRTIHGNK